jgi:large subunit ribosomal protein L21
MYAVVSSGGKQYRVEPGATLTIDRLNGEPGSALTFDRVLLVAEGDQVSVGNPTVAGASVTATVVGPELGEKIVVFKFRPKVHYRRRTGQRQHLTRVRIEEIQAPGIKAKPAKKAAKPATVATKAAGAKPRRSRASSASARTASAETAKSTPKATARKSTKRSAAKKAEE